MNQERVRRFSGGRLPSGVYNPVVTVDGRRWRDYELAAETAAPPPPEEDRLTDPCLPGMKDRIRVLLSDGARDAGNGGAGGVPGTVNGAAGRDGMADPDAVDEARADGEAARPDEAATVAASPGTAAAAGRASAADPAETPLEDRAVRAPGEETAGGAVAGGDAEGRTVPGQPGAVDIRAVFPESAVTEAEPESRGEEPDATLNGTANGGGRTGWAEIFAEGRNERDWLDQPFRPPRLEETRPYGRPGGLDEPEPDAQVSLAQAVSGRFPDPRGTWIRLINAEGPTEDPFRSTNALDCSLAVISTWHGEPVVAARRYPEYDVLGRPLMTGETGGVARAEAWLGHRFEYVGHGRRAYVAIAQRLIFGGHGASAVLITRWPAGGSHAWNAVNSNGEVLWIDAQRGHMAVEPPYEEVTGVFSVVIDRHGQRL